jgi:hypothetical protein
VYAIKVGGTRDEREVFGIAKRRCEALMDALGADEGEVREEGNAEKWFVCHRIGGPGATGRFSWKQIAF